jgi:hypothetical protein
MIPKSGHRFSEQVLLGLFLSGFLISFGCKKWRERAMEAILACSYVMHPTLAGWTPPPDGRDAAAAAIFTPMCRTFLRRCTAIVAAYAVALQFVLSAFAVAPVLSAEAGFTICRGDNPDTHPPPHDPCAACTVHCATAADNPERVAIAAPWRLARAVSEASPHIRAAPPAPARLAHSPRAPPAG